MGFMPVAKHKVAKQIHRAPRRSVEAAYRGVHVQAPAGRSRFTLSQLKKAIEAAILKNADVFSGKV